MANDVYTVCKVTSPATPAPVTPPAAGDVADQLIDDLLRSCPAHRPGTRPIHAPGIGAQGWFAATPVASKFTTAAHFAGQRVPVTVRFSNATGDMDDPDSTPTVRGMATKFHLGEVTCDEWHVMHSVNKADETDLIAMTLPMFMVGDVASFRLFVTAATATDPKRVPLWRRLLGLVRLETPYPTPPLGIPSNDQTVFDFGEAHPTACPALVYLDGNFVPESYTTCSYHAVHSFRLDGPDGTTRWARFHWEPVDGVQTAPADAGGNFLRGGLRERILSGHAEFVLRAQLAEEGDDLADPTRPWPTNRPRLVMGHLKLTHVPDDQFHGSELLSFNPTRLVRGIGLSSDPILVVRGEVYERSSIRRLAAAKTAVTFNADPSSSC